MRIFWNIFLIFLPSIFVAGCAGILAKNKENRAIFFSLISPELRFADGGFLSENSLGMNIELYKLGQAVLKIKIAKKICLNAACYEKKIFNKRFFKNEYYEDFLEDLLRGKPLRVGGEVEKTDCGFRQDFQKRSYEVCGGKISFFDPVHKIKLRLEKGPR